MATADRVVYQLNRLQTRKETLGREIAEAEGKIKVHMDTLKDLGLIGEAHAEEELAKLREQAAKLREELDTSIESLTKSIEEAQLYE